MHTMYDFVKEREQAMFEEGQMANKIAVAIKMLSMGMDLAMISEATGLTEDEIKKLDR